MARQYLTAHATFIVSPSGSDANDGVTAPKQTMTAMWNALRDQYDLGGQSVTVNCNNVGGVLAGFLASGRLTGAPGMQAVRFVGNEASPELIGIGGVDAVTVEAGAELEMSGFDFRGSQRGLVCTNAKVFFGKCWFEQCSLAQVDGCGQGTLMCQTAPLVMLGGANYAFLAEQYCQMLLRASTIQWGGATPTYLAGFYVDQYSDIDLTDATFLYSFHGKKFDGGNGAILSTNGIGASMIPGDLPGAFSFGNGILC